MMASPPWGAPRKHLTGRPADRVGVSVSTRRNQIEKAHLGFLIGEPGGYVETYRPGPFYRLGGALVITQKSANFFLWGCAQ